MQDLRVTEFREVEPDWLALMWCLDQYRVAGVPPREMGNPKLAAGKRLAAVYRNKGHWFATLVSLLLQNRTGVTIRPRNRVQGMSQFHQVDVAWPAREQDALVCAETKVTGAPAYGTTPARGAFADFSNRRKELKFAATDLKLYRRDQETRIEHWGDWREQAPPKTFFLWAARLHTGVGKKDDIATMAREAQALVNSYLDGVGIAAWRIDAAGSAYDPVPIPQEASITALDDVLYRIASFIRRQEPVPVRPDARAVDAEALLPDSDKE